MPDDGFVGLDPEDLERLARSMRRAATRLSESVGRIRQRMFSTVTWSGRDADDLNEYWQHVGVAQYRRAEESLLELARSLHRNLDEQVNASRRRTGDEVTPPVSAPPPVATLSDSEFLRAAETGAVVAAVAGASGEGQDDVTDPETNGTPQVAVTEESTLIAAADPVESAAEPALESTPNEGDGEQIGGELGDAATGTSSDLVGNGSISRQTLSDFGAIDPVTEPDASSEAGVLASATPYSNATLPEAPAVASSAGVAEPPSLPHVSAALLGILIGSGAGFTAGKGAVRAVRGRAEQPESFPVPGV